MGMVVKLTQTIGLHRDGAKFSLSPEETLYRRSLMWEVYTYESLQSLTFGRPNSFVLSSIDCRMAHETTYNEFGDVEMDFTAWKHRFSSQCLSLVHDYAFGARTPSYQIIQELDKKVRGFYIPPSLQVPGFGGKIQTSPLVTNSEMERPSMQLTLQRYITFAIKELTIFYMHRGYFARSAEENKDDPLAGKYGSSVLAAHGSACSLINLIESLHSQHPGIVERMWFLFTHIFSCSIVLGSIAIKFPGNPLSRSAISNLETSYLLFASVSHHNLAMKVLPVLTRLRERVSTSMSNFQSRRSLSSRFLPEILEDRDDTDELVGGRTRLVAHKTSSKSSSRVGLESLSAPSPPEKPQIHIRSPSDFSVEILSNVDTSVDSPMMGQQDNWSLFSQQTSPFQFQGLQTPNNPYEDQSQAPVHWHPNLRPFENNHHHQSRLISSNGRQPEQMTLVTTSSSPSNWDMFGLGETSSVNGATMLHSQQQTSPLSPPTNDAHADWQYFLTQTLQG